MKTIRVYQLTHLSPSLFQRLKEAQVQAALVWNLCVETHRDARMTHALWPGRNDLQRATKGRYALHSQSVQMVVHAFLANVEATRTLRRAHPEMRVKYPWRGIRSLKRQRLRQLGRLAKKQSRCTRQSRRWKKLQRARNKVCRRVERRIGDLRHKGTRQVIAFCVKNRVGTLFVGNPHGLRRENKGRHHNQRMSGWEYGKDIDYLTHKAKAAHIMSATSSERGTSSRCPVCGHRHKPKGRTWACRVCGFRGHRDLVGSVNMHALAYGSQVMFPRSADVSPSWLVQVKE